jgi:cytochrome b561
MQAAIAHFLMLVFAGFIATLGWSVARNPTRTLRFFTHPELSLRLVTDLASRVQDRWLVFHRWRQLRGRSR